MSLAALLIAGALLGAPPPCTSRTYDGPLGLRWGQSADAVVQALEDRFEFEEQAIELGHDASALLAEGDFAGRRTEMVAFIFTTDELAVVLVSLQHLDQRPALRRWREVVDELRQVHGPPTSIAKEPALPGEAVAREAKKRPALRGTASLLEAMGGGGNRDALLEVEITNGRWEPKAEWKFRNATIAVRVSANEPDEFGVRRLSVDWLFGDNARMETARKSGRSAKIRDY